MRKESAETRLKRMIDEANSGASLEDPPPPQPPQTKDCPDQFTTFLLGLALGVLLSTGTWLIISGGTLSELSKKISHRTESSQNSFAMSDSSTGKSVAITSNHTITDNGTAPFDDHAQLQQKPITRLQQKDLAGLVSAASKTQGVSQRQIWKDLKDELDVRKIDDIRRMNFEYAKEFLMDYTVHR